LVTAIENLAPMAGRSNPWLLLADDGRRYIVKFTNNPYGPRILANEFLGTRLARECGLAVPEMAVVRVREGMPHPAGLHFGSRVHLNRSQTIAHDWLPEPAWS